MMFYQRIIRGSALSCALICLYKIGLWFLKRKIAHTKRLARDKKLIELAQNSQLGIQGTYLKGRKGSDLPKVYSEMLAHSQIVVIDDVNECEKQCEMMLDMLDYPAIMGIDAEWKPRKNPNVALLQLSCGPLTLVIQILKLSPLSLCVCVCACIYMCVCVRLIFMSHPRLYPCPYIDTYTQYTFSSIHHIQYIDIYIYGYWYISESMPPSLRQLLSHTGIYKCGVGVFNDASKLKNEFDLQVTNCTELQV